MTDFVCPLYVKDASNTDQVKEAIDFFDTILENFEQTFEVEVEYSEYDALDLIKAFSRDVKKLKDIDEIDASPFRLGGLIAFWIRKIKPIQRVLKINDSDIEIQKKYKRYRNEIIALYLGLTICISGGRDSVSCPESSYVISDKDLQEIIFNQFDSLFFDLRYRAISPHAMATIFNLSVTRK